MDMNVRKLLVYSVVERSLGNPKSSKVSLR